HTVDRTRCRNWRKVAVYIGCLLYIHRELSVWSCWMSSTVTRRMKKISKNWQSFLARKAMHIYKSTILFLPILAYLRICSKSPRIYFAFHAEYPCLFLPIFCHLTCVKHVI